MSAETLRRAAALMRERATDATPGPWEFNSSMEDDLHADAAGWIGHDRAGDGFQEFVASTADHPDGFGDGVHIASWHPAVALAVADCIDAALCYFDPDEFSEAEREMHDSLLTLARTYLNESA